MNWWFRQQLYLQIIVCLIIGIALGFLLGEKVKLLEPIGEIFIRLLKMLIVPLTFFTLINGVVRMKSLRHLRSLGGAALLGFAATTLLAVIIGISVALILQPGAGNSAAITGSEVAQVTEFNFIDNLVSWIPVNPIEAMVTGNMLQIITFSIIVGFGLLALGEKVSKLTGLFEDAAELMLKITDFVVKLAPYGILALVANMVATLEVSTLAEISQFIISDILANIIVLTCLYPVIIKFFAKSSPIAFYKNISSVMLVAASTTSSLATLPVSMKVAEDKLGIPGNCFGFTLPLGATINMDGMAAAIGVIAVFAANFHALAITPFLLFQVLFLGVILSIGTAGVKSAGVVISTILLQTLDLPLTLIPIFAAIWPLIDVGHTTCNVTGDLVVTHTLFTRWKGEKN